MPEFDDEPPTKPRWSEPTDTDYKALIRALEAKVTTLAREKGDRDLTIAQMQATNAALQGVVRGLREANEALSARLQFIWNEATEVERKRHERKAIAKDDSTPEIIITDFDDTNESRK
jgi:peptidoglycan hydrolase CwlO-like protein